MGHPSDWDDVRAAFPEYVTSAVEIEPASDWQSSLKQLSESTCEQSVLIGYSMGARLALGLALEYPHRYEGLIFVSGNPGLESDDACEQRREADEQVAKKIEAGLVEPFLKDWYQASVFAALPEEIRKVEIQRKMARCSTHWPAILRANSVSQQPNYWPRLNELSIPTVVVAGELDEKYSKIAAKIAEESDSPDLSAQVVSECGHMVHREQPTALVQIIRDFVDECSSQPDA